MAIAIGYIHSIKRQAKVLKLYTDENLYIHALRVTIVNGFNIKCASRSICKI